MASVSCIIIYTLLLVSVCFAVAKNTTNSSSSSSSLESESERDKHCSWSGSGCSEEGRVVSITCEYYYIGSELGKLNFSSFPYLQTLDLSGCKLNGSIPYQIGMLSKLKYLSLYGNYLTGSIPSEIGTLSNLIELYLYDNRLTGTIPSALGSLTKLKLMDLHNNQLSGSLDLHDANLSHLQTPIYNSLTGVIPIFKCSGLQYLSLSDNLLSGNIPKELGNCYSLVELDLSSNK
ncbi:putative leucine-rich repeat receptor-like protein kinase [Heracleum sosnowskyi]|uniref:Leucine-rich repeat receptor-like protein kinase n=1 Tax=Heracleum sosnowskyi TaxID=360622 RepID=A0AAD8I9X7_9APIA|nr:putative leucine-rich repeat receptor-like protein kinase [Heracleum sosnowskyi]